MLGGGGRGEEGEGEGRGVFEGECLFEAGCAVLVLGFLLYFILFYIYLFIYLYYYYYYFFFLLSITVLNQKCPLSNFFCSSKHSTV